MAWCRKLAYGMYVSFRHQTFNFRCGEYREPLLFRHIALVAHLRDLESVRTCSAAYESPVTVGFCQSLTPTLCIVCGYREERFHYRLLIVTLL